MWRRISVAVLGVALGALSATAAGGAETYGAGRYLYAPLSAERVDLDFNRAYNPPCVFTPFATCPLPPPGNRLPVAIRAGEKAYSK